MKLFLDTANIDEIREAASWGVLDGVTTNPSLLAKEGRDFKEVITEITKIVKGPISAECVTMKAEEMVKEGREFSTWGEHVVVKVPMGREGLKAVSMMAREGIRTNVTLIFSPNQALLAARAGATFVSPFVGRLDDISHFGTDCIADLVEIYDNYDIKTEIIAASIRHPLHVIEAAKYGAHIATIPFKVLELMVDHPLTERGIKRFTADWEALQGKTKKK